jgi:hypothetical protein
VSKKIILEEGKNENWFSARVSRTTDRESGKRKETVLLRATESTRKKVVSWYSQAITHSNAFAFVYILLIACYCIVMCRVDRTLYINVQSFPHVGTYMSSSGIFPNNIKV